MTRAHVSFFASAIALGLVLAPNAVARALDLNSEGGLRFDIQDTRDGTLSDGAGDAYDGCYGFVVNGTAYNSGGASSSTSLSGRQVDMPAVTIGGTLSAKRFIYVPSTGGDYARFLDVVTNTGATPATVTLAMTCNLGSDGSETVFSTGSGDTICTTADGFCNSDDVEVGGDPALGHVFQGASPSTRATTVMLGSGTMGWSFSVTIPPGGRAAILSFGIQKRSRMPVTDEATALSDPADAALVGLDDYLDDIVNFCIAPAGAPRVTFDAPAVADEGAAISIGATVTDIEGDPSTWSWDLDGDGTFGEMPGATTYTVAAGTTDGPTSNVRVGIQASDGTNVSQCYRSVGITNLPPVITSPIPAIITGVGANYLYQIVATDPAGALDPLTYSLVAGPTDMVISPTGLLQWTPDDLDVTRLDELIRIEISVADGDGGVASQSWDLTVSPNRTPSTPVPVYPVGDVGLVDMMPRLVANNSSDADFDLLTYSFEIDATPTFDSPVLQRVESVTQTPGFSYWYPTTPLAAGRWYWRVRAYDGTTSSEAQMATFYRVPVASELVDLGPARDDGGFVPGVDGGTTVTSAPRDEGGCSVGAGSPSRTSAFWALGVLGLTALLLRTRRRR